MQHSINSISVGQATFDESSFATVGRRAGCLCATLQRESLCDPERLKPVCLSSLAWHGDKKSAPDQRNSQRQS
jgi:hypothetical protein